LGKVSSCPLTAILGGDKLPFPINFLFFKRVNGELKNDFGFILIMRADYLKGDNQLFSFQFLYRVLKRPGTIAEIALHLTHSDFVCLNAVFVPVALIEQVQIDKLSAS